MSDKAKFALIGILALSGAGLIGKSFLGGRSNTATAAMAPANPAPATTAVPVAQDQPVATGNGLKVIEQIKKLPAKKPAAPKDIDHIYQLASVDVAEAYASYKIFVDYVLDEQASNQTNLQRLIRGTIAFTDVDPGNDHYYALAEVWQKYPKQIEQAVYSLSLSSAQKMEIMNMLESWADVREHGNG